MMYPGCGEASFVAGSNALSMGQESIMPYSEEISRLNPTCFIFLLDQSGSMAEPFGESGLRKADCCALMSPVKTICDASWREKQHGAPFLRRRESI